MIEVVINIGHPITLDLFECPLGAHDSSLRLLYGLFLRSKIVTILRKVLLELQIVHA